MAKTTPLTLTKEQLDRLGRWCDERSASGEPDPTVPLRVVTVRALLRMARYGTALATVNAKPFKQLSAAGRKAANARWDRARAQRTEAPPQKCEGVPVEKSTP